MRGTGRLSAIAMALLLLGSCAHAPDPQAEVPARVAGEEAELERLRRKETSLLFWSADERRLAFQHMAELFPTREVRAGGEPYPLEERPVDLTGVPYRLDGRRYTLADLMAMPAQIGFIVVKDGDILMERYAEGHDRHTLWVSFSITKSVTSLLIGAAIADGFIASVDEPVTHYLPRLRGTGYEGARIRDVLQMASGLAWNEDYGDPDSDVARAGAANGLALVNYLAGLERVHAPGEVFNYNTGETNLAGEILRAAIGNNASTYLSHRIWRPFGMEADANWLTGGVGGGETGGCCISATLRDYARLGLFAMHGGQLPDGRRVLPEAWMAESVAPSAGSPSYGYLWWLSEDEGYAALGIFGQRIEIDPAARVVIAAHSNAPAAVGTDYHRHLSAAITALRRHLR